MVFCHLFRTIAALYLRSRFELIEIMRQSNMKVGEGAGRGKIEN